MFVIDGSSPSHRMPRSYGIQKPDVVYSSMGIVEAHLLTYAARRSFSPPSCTSGASNLVRVPQQALTIIYILLFPEQSRKCNKSSLLNSLLPRIQFSFPPLSASFIIFSSLVSPRSIAMSNNNPTGINQHIHCRMWPVFDYHGICSSLTPTVI